MTMREFPYARALLWIAGTFLVLLLGLWVTGQWVPIGIAQRGGVNPAVAANLPVSSEVSVISQPWGRGI